MAKLANVNAAVELTSLLAPQPNQRPRKWLVSPANVRYPLKQISKVTPASVNSGRGEGKARLDLK